MTRSSGRWIDAHDVFPPVRTVPGPGLGIDPRTPHNFTVIAPITSQSTIDDRGLKNHCISSSSGESSFTLPAMLTYVIAVPPTQHRFLSRVEHHSLDALHMKIAEERVVPAAEAEQGHRGRHPHIYADHARLDVADEFSGRRAAGGE